MKLINPAGRDIRTFSTEVNRCACMCYNDWNMTRAFSNSSTCKCSCKIGNDKNGNANMNAAIRAK